MARATRLVTGKFVTYELGGSSATEVPVVDLVVQINTPREYLKDLAVPQTAFLPTYEGRTDSSGTLVSPSGSIGIRVPVTNPENFTYDVRIIPPDASQARPYEFRVLIPSGSGSFDITEAIPVPGDPGQDFSDWLSILTPIENLRGQVLESAQQAEQSKIAAQQASDEAKSAVNDRVGKFAGNNNGVYIPSGLSSLRLRQRRNHVATGSRQGHIAFLGDSITYGAGGSGTTPPKNVTAYPGRVRAGAEQRFGASGSGMTIFNHLLLANPSWDSRLTASAGVVTSPYGFHRTGAWRVPVGSYVEFTAYCDEFWVWNLQATGSVNSVTIDGVPAGTFRDQKGVPGGSATNPMSAGYGALQMMTRIPAPSLGVHTLRIIPGAASNLTLLGVEGRVAKLGTWRVSNPSVSGKSLGSLFAAPGFEDTNEFFGLGLVDSLRADVLLIALGLNDWHEGRSKTWIKDALRTLVQRQRSSGTTGHATYPGQHANGDAVLLFPPQVRLKANGLPDYAGGQGAIIPWSDLRAAFYEIADEQGVVLIDMGMRWDGFQPGWDAGLFGDPLHPNDAGSTDLADGALQALFEVI